MPEITTEEVEALAVGLADDRHFVAAKTLRALDAELRELQAQNERLLSVAKLVWDEANAMRHSRKTVGMWENDRKLNTAYHKTMYAAGRKLIDIIKPIRSLMTKEG